MSSNSRSQNTRKNSFRGYTPSPKDLSLFEHNALGYEPVTTAGEYYEGYQYRSRARCCTACRGRGFCVVRPLRRTNGDPSAVLARSCQRCERGNLQCSLPRANLSLPRSTSAPFVSADNRVNTPPSAPASGSASRAVPEGSKATPLSPSSSRAPGPVKMSDGPKIGEQPTPTPITATSDTTADDALPRPLSPASQLLAEVDEMFLEWEANKPPTWKSNVGPRSRPEDYFDTPTSFPDPDGPWKKR